MNKAIVTFCKALAQILNAHWAEFDRETSNLMGALADYIRKYGDDPNI